MRILSPQGELLSADLDSVVHEHGRDQLLITHQVDLEPMFREVAHRKHQNPTGFSQGRTMRYLGSVPLMTLLRRPDLADDKNLKKYLRERPRCRAVPHGSL